MAYFFYFFLMLFPIQNLLATKPDLSHLPEPYSSVHLLPFNPHGWFQNAKQLELLIEKHKVKTVIEVGSWMGASTRFLAQQLPDDGIVYAVDTWEGSPNENHDPEILRTLYDQFLSNVIHTGLVHKIVPIKMDSLSAAKELDVVPDLIYLDATHTPEEVYNDLCAWFPFVKGHGVICGDDWAWGYYAVAKGVQKFAKEHDLLIHVRYDWFWYLEEQ